VLWDVVTIQSGATLAVGSITENNFQGSLSLHPQAGSWEAICDQWCIPQMSVKLLSAEPPGSLTAVPICYTALDFDNVTNLGSTAAILAFDNARTDAMVDNKSVVRTVRPCLKLTATSLASAATSQQWCDCAAPTVQWNGIRTMFNALPSGSTVFNVSFEFTIWFAFRNRI
jgi:hypothetical protein